MPSTTPRAIATHHNPITHPSIAHRPSAVERLAAHFLISPSMSSTRTAVSPFGNASHRERPGWHLACSAAAGRIARTTKEGMMTKMNRLVSYVALVALASFGAVTRVGAEGGLTLE